MGCHRPKRSAASAYQPGCRQRRRSLPICILMSGRLALIRLNIQKEEATVKPNTVANSQPYPAWRPKREGETGHEGSTQPAADRELSAQRLSCDRELSGRGGV